MRLETVATAGAGPVPLADAKLWLRVDHNHEDGLIEQLVLSAANYVERYTGAAMTPQTLRVAVSPWEIPFSFPCPPFGALQSADALLYDGTVLAFDMAACFFVAGTEPGRLHIKPGFYIPGGTVELRFTYTTNPPATMPAAAVQAIRMLTAQWYENREAAGASATELAEPPNAVKALLSTLCVARL